MKALIYAGIGLFSVASVYGIADYYQSQKKGTLNRLYKDDDEMVATQKASKETVAMPISTKNGEEINVPVNETKVTRVNKTVKAPKRIRMEDFSRGKIAPPPVIVETALEEIPKEVVEIKPDVVKPIKPVEEKLSEESGRSLSFEMFSRAPLKKKVKPIKEVEKQATKN